jgi:hypothetical protein
MRNGPGWTSSEDEDSSSDESAALPPLRQLPSGMEAEARGEAAENPAPLLEALSTTDPASVPPLGQLGTSPGSAAVSEPASVAGPAAEPALTTSAPRLVEEKTDVDSKVPQLVKLFDSRPTDFTLAFNMVRTCCKITSLTTDHQPIYNFRWHLSYGK